MSVATELCVQIPNEPGTLGELSEVLGRAGINVGGFGVWEDCARLLVDDVDQALELLRGAGFTCRTNRVLCVDLPDEPGNLSELARELGRAGINIDHAYTVTPRAERACTFVLAVIDPRVAEKALG